MKKYIFIILLTLFYNCKNKLCYEERSINEMKEVFLKDNLNYGFYQSLIEYKLSNEELEMSIKLIKKAFEEYNNNLKIKEYKREALPNFKKYSYILSSCLDEKRNKVVFINGYLTNGSCPDLGTLKEWYEVCDGGNSMIQFRMNLSEKSVSYIMPNGEA